MKRLAAVLLLVVVLAPQAASAESAAYAPRVVVAAKTNDGALVAWLPGDEMPDSFNVYGLSASGRKLLENVLPSGQTEALGALVEGDFARYGVTGVKDGVESPLRLAIGSDEGAQPGCVQIILTPEPDVAIYCVPLPRIAIQTQLTQAIIA